jgi:hypothetical protein
MKALISPNEQTANDNGDIVGVRVVEKHSSGFDVASPLFWIDCEDAMVPEECYYDTDSKIIKLLPGYAKKMQEPIPSVEPIVEYTEL